MTELTLEERVEIGVRFLDDTVPNWRDIISRSTEPLNMGWARACVLGQVFGWYDGVEALYEWSFTQTLPDLDEPLHEIAGFEKTVSTYPELQAEWLRVIANEPECDGCDQDPWRKAVHYGTCPLAVTVPA